MISHPATGFPVSDPDLHPLAADALPSAAEIASAAASLILSASGWRKVFAASGDEESNSGELSAADKVLVGAAALAFANFIKRKSGRADPTVIVGIDSRPTGPTIADAMIRVFLGMGMKVRYLFIVAAPEIMAYAREAGMASDSERAAGFCYISASHNPRGHNGLKFGSGGGGVIGGAESADLIAAYKALLAESGLAERVLDLMEGAEQREIAKAFADCSSWKRRSISAYTLLVREIVSGASELTEQEKLFDSMAEQATKRPIGVVAELNGSARSLSIDRDFLEGLGLRARFLNDAPRQFSHRIVPEGESLDEAKRELERERAEDGSYCLGYVPDCDGDRGNLVVATNDGARALEAQEVFALSCVAELACLVHTGALSYDKSGKSERKVAIVVNDATSMRIEAIGHAFGAEVHRAETGEANVVGLAAALREQGYLVRILGEGSNGGNITEPSQVRDPLATVGAVLKLLLLRGQGSGRGGGLFSIWLRQAKAAGIDVGSASAAGDYGLDEILASLPRFATTSVFEERAALRVASADKAALKGRYAKLFLRDWEARRPELARRFGITAWKAFASNGQGQSEIGEDFASSGKGGLRIIFFNDEGLPRAFLWMRGSGTEPVFRVMADIDGGRAIDEEYLLAWHTALVREADDGLA